MLEQELLRWADSHGAKTSNLSFRNNDSAKNSAREVVALHPISNGAEICFIPSNLLLSETVAKASTIGQLISRQMELVNDTTIASKAYPYALEMICMAAFMIQQRRLPGSFWKPYLDSLPADYNLPVCWPVQLIDSLLVGTSLHYMTHRKLEWIEKVVTLINSCTNQQLDQNITKDDLIWAYASITSRAFPKASRSKISSSVDPEEDWITVSEICLYPVLDMLNHRRGFKIEWVMSDKGVSFVAREDIEKCTPISNNYGPKGNENLLSNYGFVLESNQEDYVKLFLNVSDQDPLASKKRALIESQGLSQFQLFFKDDSNLSTKLLSVARIMVADPYHLQELQRNKFYLKNDVLALTTLHLLISTKLADMGVNTIQSTSDRSKLALCYRNGQREILSNSLRLVAKYTKEILAIASNPGISTKFLCTLEKITDDFTDLAFLIVRLVQDESSLWYRSLSLYHSRYTAKVCKIILGDEYLVFKEFWSDEILPALPKSTKKLKSLFLYAFTMLTVHGGDIPAYLGHANFGIFLDPDSRE